MPQSHARGPSQACAILHPHVTNPIPNFSPSPLSAKTELCDRSLQPAMEETSEKIPIALAGPEDLQQFMPPVSHLHAIITLKQQTKKKHYKHVFFL